MSAATERASIIKRPETARFLQVLSRPWPLVDAFFVGILLLVAIARWTLLTKSPYPPGIDPGNWLAFGHALVGEHIRSSSIVYPPVVPLLTLTASRLFGPFLGVQLLAEVSSILPAIAAYLVLRDSAGGWPGAILANFLAAASSTYEAMAWGGYPQLIGLGFLILFLWAFDRYLRTRLRLHALLAGVILALTLATSDIIGASAVVTGLFLLLGHLILRPTGKLEPGKMAAGLALVVLPCVPLVPLYVQLVTSVFGSFHARRTDTFLSAGALPPAAATIYRDFPLFWRTAVLLAVLAPIALISLRRTRLWLIGTSMLFGIAALVIGLKEFRFLYLLPPLAILGVACWTEFFRRSFVSIRWAGAAISVLLLFLLGLQSLYGLQNLRANLLPYYTFLTPGLVSGLEWIRDKTPRDAVIASTASRGEYPLGWWIEGFSSRKTLYAANPEWLNFADERDRAIKAAQIFDVTVPLDVNLKRARRLGVSYLMINKEWMGHGLWEPKNSSLQPLDIVVDNESILLLRIR